MDDCDLLLKLKAASQSEFADELHVSTVQVIDSKNIDFIQLADLFIWNRESTLEP
jgi:hypothetical protein